MLRPSASRRQVLGIALALSVGTGIGLGAYSLGSAAGTDTVNFPRVGPATPAADSTPAEASTSTPLTLDQAAAVAAEVAPGRVIEWDEDHEPTGLRYDVKLLHDDGSTTDVEVDTVTGQVTSVDHDNDGD